MRCPVDQTPLKLAEKNHSVGMWCRGCHGIFLPDKYVVAFNNNYATKALAHLRNVNRLNQAARGCPGCDQPMAVALVKNIEVDHCRTCRGMWFDSEELESIIKQIGQHPWSTGSLALDAVLALLRHGF